MNIFSLFKFTLIEYIDQVTKIATGETEKNEVVESTLKLFHEKFQSFRANMQRVDRFFAPKGQGQGERGGWGGGKSCLYQTQLHKV